MNAYDKLRPWTEIESCECAEVSKLFLLDMLTDNPIHCAFCRREVDPERLNLSVEETEAVARWFSVASALYKLWLDSGEYEDYAKSKLVDPDSQVNRHGREVVIKLSQRIPTQLWFFHDTDDGKPTKCPVCKKTLDLDVKWGSGQCDQCGIHI